MADRIEEVKKILSDFAYGRYNTERLNVEEQAEWKAKLICQLFEPKPSGRLLTKERMLDILGYIKFAPSFYDELVRIAKAQATLTASIKDAEIQALHRERNGEVWYWQGDGEDHLESLTCPVLIEAEDLRRFGQARIEALIEEVAQGVEGFIQSPKMPNELSLCIKVWLEALKATHLPTSNKENGE